MNGTSTNTGLTYIGDGVLYLGRNNALSSNSHLEVNGGAIVDLKGFSQSALSLSGSGIIRNTVAESNSIFTFTGPTDKTLNGFFDETEGGGIISLVMSGSGQFSIAGRQDFSGTITINSGTLVAANANADGFGSGNIIFAGGTLKYQNQSNDYSARISTNSTGNQDKH